MNFKQRKILKLISLSPGLKYSEIYHHFEEEDKFPYHLKQLIAKKYVVKQDTSYYLTHLGFTFAVNKVNSQYDELEHKVPRVLLVCKQDDKYLIKDYFTVSKVHSPRFALPAVRLNFSVYPLKSLVNLNLVENFGVEGVPKFRCVQNCVFLSAEDEVIFDFIYLVFDVTVEKVVWTDESMRWETAAEIAKLPQISYALKEFVVKNNHSSFMESLVKGDYFPN